MRSLGERRFAVSGTPGDCVTLGVLELTKDALPDLVLSGVNRGHNLAEDVTRSGHGGRGHRGHGALGVPSIALSQALTYSDGQARVDFAAAEAFAPGIIKRLVEVGWPNDVVININFPGRPPEAIRSRRGDASRRSATMQTLATSSASHGHQRGGDYFWIGYRNIRSTPADGTDLRAFYDGRISVTPLHIDLTHMKTVHDLKAVLGGAPPKA